MEPLLTVEGLGTHWWVTVYDAEVRKDHVRTRLLTTIQKFERDYSRFIPESLIGKLNSGMAIKQPPQELLDLLQWGERLREISHGFFNLGVGLSLERLGYDAQYSFESGNITPLSGSSPFSQLDTHEIKLIPGNKIDLGGIGKGWLIDVLAEVLREEGLHFFVINGGGDIYGTSNNGKPFECALENPFNDTQSIGTIRVDTMAIAASGGQKRRWHDKNTGKEHHHLVNPFSGQSSHERAGVFTAARTARVADAASTVLFLVPPQLVESSATVLQVEYCIVYPDGHAVRSPHYQGELYS